MTAWVGSVPRAIGGMALVLVPLAAAAQTAQDAPPVRVRGEIASVDDRVVTVQTRDGEVARLELAADARVLGMAPTTPEALAVDDVIGAAAAGQPGEPQEAVVVVVVPEELGGAGEGYFTWDLTPDTMMIQGVVRGVEAGPDGLVLSVYYPQAGATVVVPPDVPVVALEAGDAGLLQPGSHVFVPSAERRPDGTLSTGLVAVGRNGFVPPMM